MMQRRNIRGQDLTPCAIQYTGTINAEKCIIYLRGIGVDIDDTTADAWLDTQATHRFLKSERSIWRRCYVWNCRCGEMEGFSESGRGRHRLKHDKKEPRIPAKCESCGTGFVSSWLVFAVRRDGTVLDRRQGVDAVIPLRLDEWAGGL